MLKTLSVLGLVAMVLSLLGLIVARALFSPSPLVIAVQVAAAALMIWARVTFGLRSFHAAANPTTGGLVTSGPYHYIRHPIYTAFVFFGWAGVVAHPTPVALALGAALFAGGLTRMLCEERLIVGRYPEYRQYAATTKRMIPYLF